jgi:hypothetical protein
VFLGQLEALNFFNKLSEADSLTLLQECTLDHAKLFFVQENHVQAFACTLSHKLYTKKFYIDTDRKKINLDQKYSFCVKYLGKVYFFKSELSEDSKGVYFTNNVYLYELQRRKHTRFDIPDEWLQSCSIYQSLKKAPQIGASVVNISWSGLRLKVGPQLPEFKLNQEIQFTLRIHRRAEFLATGEIVYIKKNKKTGPLLGIQFKNTSHLLESKVQNICDDLLRYFVLKQKNTV